MASLATIASVVTAGVPIVLSVWGTLQNLKPASQVEEVIKILGLDKKYGRTTAGKIAKVIISTAKSIGLGKYGGAMPPQSIIIAKLKKQGLGGAKKNKTFKGMVAGPKLTGERLPGFGPVAGPRFGELSSGGAPIVLNRRVGRPRKYSVKRGGASLKL